MFDCVRTTLAFALVMLAAGCSESPQPPRPEPTVAPSPFFGLWQLETISGRRLDGMGAVDVDRDGHLRLKGCGEFGGYVRAGTPAKIESDGMVHGCDEAAWKVQLQLMELFASRPDVSLTPPNTEPCDGPVCPCTTPRLAVRSDAGIATFCNATIFEE